MKSKVLPSRTSTRIQTSICRQCFVAVPTDRLDEHEKWHQNRKKMAS